MAKAALPAAHSSSDSAANADIVRGREREESADDLGEGVAASGFMRIQLPNAPCICNKYRKCHSLFTCEEKTTRLGRIAIRHVSLLPSSRALRNDQIAHSLGGGSLNDKGSPTRVTWVFFSRPRHGSMNGDLIWCHQGHFRHFTRAFVEVDFPKKRNFLEFLEMGNDRLRKWPFYLLRW